jgi:hypothetical protein
MAGKSEKMHTQVLTNDVFTIVESMGIRTVSMQLVSGVGSFKGDLKIGAMVSAPIDLIVGTPVTLGSDTSRPLDGITIDCSGGGVINYILRQ